MNRFLTIGLTARASILALMLTAIGCSYSSPTAPATGGDGTPGPVGATISLTANGLSPSSVTISAGQSVTFTNNDSVAHQIASEPVPTYTDCPSINRVNRLEPGQSVETGALTAARSCGFLDLLRTDDARFQGTIVVQ